MASFPAVLKSEWTKIRTVSSTVWTLVAAVVVTVGLSAALCAFFNASFKDMPPEQQLTFDPTVASFAGMSLGQLAMIVFGVLVVGTEYSSGMIRTSLAAVPRRGSFLFGKLLVATSLALVVGLVTSFLSFFLGQAILGDRSIGIGEDNVLRAVIGAGLYMAMIALFSMGVASILRSSILALGILMPFFFLVSNILGAVDATRKVAQYFPDQAGSKIMQVVPGAMDSGSTPYGPWGGFGIMLLWVAASVIGGYVVLRKRDA
ncbi:ABC transporter permease subunit [Streptomyces subrutilus]|uniref:ABC transporter permease n=1 Tax=Streptomyces subrutilus TaxID=36818 RepID=A0A5P2UXD5_9ACTN|nr:ABC transporter permease subunit [Streptomyces subrutilus]QEU82855.1 ABC transporter permease [Streptomyces subrutilus]WSJ34298.1 ABC transporter permease [Streptomyces subrutilus]